MKEGREVTMKSGELDRVLDAVVETVFDADNSKVLRQIEAIDRDPQVEAGMLRGMLERTIEAFERFYEAKQTEELLTPEQVAARYGHTLDWLYKSRELRAIQVKVGKCLRWREADLKKLESSQQNKRRGFRIMRRIPEEQANADHKAKVWAI